MTLELRSASIADTHAIAGAIAEYSRAGDMIVLSGEMGAGKTAFAQGFGRALGVEGPITSPTFTLVHSYDVETGPRAGKITLHHADLYRLERTSEIADLALGELAEFRGIVLIEWGEVADASLGDHLVVHLRPDDDPRETESGAASANDVVNIAGDPLTVADDDSDVLSLDGRRLVDVDGIGRSWAARWELLAAGLGRFAC